MSDVLVLCHGNKFRSPAAEAFLHALGVPVTSAGFVMSANRAAKGMRDRIAGLGLGLSLEKHVPKLVTYDMVVNARWVLVMDSGNMRHYTAKFASHMEKVHLLGQWHLPPLQRIQDPAFLGRAGGARFDEIVQEIRYSCEKFAEHYHKESM